MLSPPYGVQSGDSIRYDDDAEMYFRSDKRTTFYPHKLFVVRLGACKLGEQSSQNCYGQKTKSVLTLSTAVPALTSSAPKKR